MICGGNNNPSKERKRLVVHLGLRKVATTSIQAWLQENAATLKREHNALVLARSEEFHAWREATYAFMNDKLSQKRWIRTIERQALKQRSWMLRQPETFILVSDENLFGARLYRDDGTTLYDWARLALPRIEDIWKPAFDLTFVMYLRQDESAWIRSCYNQEVKNNRLTLSYEEWAAKIPPNNQDWNRQFRSLPSILESPLRIVTLGEEPQFGSTLVQELGVPLSSLSPPPQQQHLNESLPEAALEFIRAVNRSQDVSFVSKAAVGAVVDSMRHLFVAEPAVVDDEDCQE